VPVDINGYNLSNAGGIALGASGSKILAANYGIKDPALPGMMGSATANGPFKVYPFPVNDMDLNNGSPWSVSTFRFTAPVAGIYYTSFSGIVGDGSATQTSQYNAIIVNGINQYFSYRDTISIWELHHIEMMMNLAAGDWVSWAMNTAPGPTTANTGGAYQSNHNISTIWLVG
jgi:hypothetical protein